MGKKRGRCIRWEPCSPATAASCAVVDDGGWKVHLDDGWKTIGIDFGAVTSGQSLCFRYGVTKYKFTFLSSDKGVQENTKTGTTSAIRRVRNPSADSADTTLAQVDGPTLFSRIASQPANYLPGRPTSVMVGEEHSRKRRRLGLQLEDLIGVWRDNKRSTYRTSQGHQGLDVTTFRPNGKVIFTRGMIYIQAGSRDIVWGKTCGRTYTLLSVDHSVVIWARSTVDRFTWSRVPEPSTPAFSHEGTAREPIGISNLGAAEVGVGSRLVMLRSKFNMRVGDICRVVGETASQNSWQVANCYNRERLSVLKNHEDVSWRWVN